jgi:integral membrane protein
VEHARFRALAIAEGVSFLVLLFVAMPLKHLAGIGVPTRIVGLVHGLLFVLYEIAVLDALGSNRWPAKRVAAGVVAGFLPFGTFVFTARLRQSSAAPTGGHVRSPAD